LVRYRHECYFLAMSGRPVPIPLQTQRCPALSSSIAGISRLTGAAAGP
jgi:hypothetical protein